jgi:hypothetical protein
MWTLHRDKDELVFEVRDDGVGGTMSVSSEVGGGTRMVGRFSIDPGGKLMGMTSTTPTITPLGPLGARVEETDLAAASQTEGKFAICDEPSAQRGALPNRYPARRDVASLVIR